MPLDLSGPAAALDGLELPRRGRLRFGLREDEREAEVFSHLRVQHDPLFSQVPEAIRACGNLRAVTFASPDSKIGLKGDVVVAFPCTYDPRFSPFSTPWKAGSTDNGTAAHEASGIARMPRC